MPFFTLRFLVAVISAAAILPAADVSFTVRFANDSNRFQVGEMIFLELNYSAVSNRDVRNHHEIFNVTPSGSDPLASLHSDPTYIDTNGGLYPPTNARTVPKKSRSILNEWVTIDKPGHYTLRVKSQRVSTTVEKQKPLPLVSNALEFDVVKADPVWQQRTLSQAVFTLSNRTASEEERRTAADTIRYLDTPDSIRELARLLTTLESPLNSDFSFGLIGARDRDLVLKELEARFTAPDAALTAEYMWLLGRIQFWGKHLTLAPYPQSDASKQPAWQAERDKVEAESDDIVRALYRQAEAALPGKNDAAKTVTAETIAQHSREAKP